MIRQVMSYSSLPDGVLYDYRMHTIKDGENVADVVMKDRSVSSGCSVGWYDLTTSLSGLLD